MAPLASSVALVETQRDHTIHEDELIFERTRGQKVRFKQTEMGGVIQKNPTPDVILDIL